MPLIQHWEGRDRWISAFKASLVYNPVFQTNQCYTMRPCQEKKKWAFLPPLGGAGLGGPSNLAKLPRASMWAWNWIRLRGIENLPMAPDMSSVEEWHTVDLTLYWA